MSASRLLWEEEEKEEEEEEEGEEEEKGAGVGAVAGAATAKVLSPPLALLAGPVGRSEPQQPAVGDRAPRRQPAGRREESVAWKLSQVTWWDGSLPDIFYRGVGWHK